MSLLAAVDRFSSVPWLFIFVLFSAAGLALAQLDRNPPFYVSTFIGNFHDYTDQDESLSCFDDFAPFDDGPYAAVSSEFWRDGQICNQTYTVCSKDAQIGTPDSSKCSVTPVKVTIIGELNPCNPKFNICPDIAFPATPWNDMFGQIGDYNNLREDVIVEHSIT